MIPPTNITANSGNPVVVEAIIDRVFNISECREMKSSHVRDHILTKGNVAQSLTSDKKQIHILSNIIINQKDESGKKIWDQQLHWLKQDVSLKNHGSREKMPFAITSDKWVE